MSLTETTTLDEVLFDATTNSVKVTWRDHIFRDGVEVDSARVARSKTYTKDDKEQFHADLGDDATKYATLF